MTLEYDLTVGALYISAADDGKVARTVPYGDNANVDLDDIGDPLGVEVVDYRCPWPAEQILGAHSFTADEAELIRMARYGMKPSVSAG